MARQNLLVELFVEELPPKALKKLGEAFAKGLLDRLQVQGLASPQSQATAFASPRRLAAHISDVTSQAVDKSVSQKLMPVNVGLGASGEPTPALLKRLTALGADASAVAGLKRGMDGRTEALFYDNVVKGATLAEGLQQALAESIAKLPIPKVMTYQLADGWTDVKFVRPAHSLLALHGADVVPVQALGLKAGNTTKGHRFEAARPIITLKEADAYAATMARDGAVIADFAPRGNRTPACGCGREGGQWCEADPR
jgi:glycyl-tRNA synthetase beta chain